MKKLFSVLFLIGLLVSVSTAQSKFGIRIDGGVALPNGDFGDLYKTGFGGTAALSYELSESVELSANTGYLNFSFNDDYLNNLLKELGSNITVDVDAPLSIIPLMIGGRYYFSQSDFKPYAGALLGVHILSISAQSVIMGYQKFDIQKEATETKMAWGVGIGFLYKIGNKLHLNVDAKLNGNSMETTQSRSYDSGNSYVEESSSSTTTFITITAGLQFEL